MTDPIVKAITVDCMPDRAFEVFVNRTSSWWPLDGHVVSVAHGKAALGVTIEPRVGGAVYETMFDGRRAEWGEVLEYDVGRKFAMTWHPGNNADAPTRVEVVFEGRADGKTDVTLIHSGWEVWGAEAQSKRDNYDKGWDFVLGENYVPAL